MGADAQMLVRTPRRLSDSEIALLDHNLGRSFPYALDCYPANPRSVLSRTAIEDFADGPDRGQDRRIPPQSRDGEWLWVHLSRRVYVPGYERGPIWEYIGITEWLEYRIPGAEVWYGSDHDDWLSPFTREVRDKLKHHFFAVGSDVDW